MAATGTEPLVLQLLASCAGVDITAAGVADTTLDDLGLDSLARLEVVTRLQNELGQPLSDNVVQGADTPRSIATSINAVLSEPGPQASSDDLALDQPSEHQRATTDVEVHIDAPLDLTWKLTNDLQSWPDLFSEYAAVDILQTDGPTTTFRLTTRPDESGQQWSWVAQRTTDRDQQSVTARRLEPGWFEYMHLRWDYTEVDAGTLLRWRQWFRMRLDSPVDQDTMTTNITCGSHVQQNRIKTIVEASAATTASTSFA